MKIKEKAVDAIGLLGNKRNKYINLVFTEKRQSVEVICVTEIEAGRSSCKKSLAPDSEINKSSHISVVPTS